MYKLEMLAHGNYKVVRRCHMQKGKRNSKQGLKHKESEKTAVNNQWTNTNLKYYPDKRDRKDGPGGE